MKKAITIAALLISFNCFSQTRKETLPTPVQKVDSIPMYFFTVNDLNAMLPLLEKQERKIGWDNLDSQAILNFLLQYLEQRKQYSIIANKTK